MTSLKEEIFLKLNPHSPPENDKWGIHVTQEVIEIIEKGIDEFINNCDDVAINKKEILKLFKREMLK